MSTVTIFIIHIHEEAGLAQALSNKLAAIFAAGQPQVKFFESFQMNPGDLWNETFQPALSECKVAIVLVSKRSVDQPWLNFEVGRVWGRHVLPVWHSGFRPSSIGSPLGVKNFLDTGQTGWMARLVQHLVHVLDWKSDSPVDSKLIHRAEDEIGAVIESLPVSWPPEGCSPAYVFQTGDKLECLRAVESELSRCQSVSFCGIGLHVFRRDAVQHLFSDRVRAGSLVSRICFANWESPAVQSRIRSEFGGRAAPHPANIFQNIVDLRYELNDPARLEVKQFDVPPPFAMMIFDSCVYTYPYGVGLTGDQCPTFCLQRDEPVLRFYSMQFEQIWGRSLVCQPVTGSWSARLGRF